MIEKVPKTYAPIKTEIIEAMCKVKLSGNQHNIIYAIIRKTYGWQKQDGSRKTDDYIAYSQITELTGINKSHISRELNELIERKIVTKIGNKIGINKIISDWSYQKLPKLVTDKHYKKLPKSVTRVTKTGNKKLPKSVNTIEKKETYTKEISTKVDTDKSVTYGNPDVNQLIAHVQEKFELPVLDDSQKMNRQYANLLLRKFGGIDNCLKLIDIASEDEWNRNNLTSLKKIYYNGVKILAKKREPKAGYTDLRGDIT